MARYKIYLCPGSEPLVQKGTECPNFAEHTPSPESYLGWHDWAEQMAKTHEQKRCEECGLCRIWVPKPGLRLAK